MNQNSKDTHKNDWQLGRILIGRREKVVNLICHGCESATIAFQVRSSIK